MPVTTEEREGLDFDSMVPLEDLGGVTTEPPVPPAKPAAPSAGPDFDNMVSADSLAEFDAGPGVEEYAQQIARSSVEGVLKDFVASTGESLAIGGTRINQWLAKHPVAESLLVNPLFTGPETRKTKPEESGMWRFAEASKDLSDWIAPAEVPELKESFLATTGPRATANAIPYFATGGASRLVLGRALSASVVGRQAFRNTLREATRQGLTQELAQAAAEKAASRGMLGVTLANYVKYNASMAELGWLNQATFGWEDAMQATHDPEKAWKAYLANAPVGTVEVVPFAHMLTRAGGKLPAVVPFASLIKRLNKLTGRRAGEVIVDALYEGGEEAGQDAIEQFWLNDYAKMTYDQKRDLWAGVSESTAAGGAAGAVISLMLSGFLRVRAGNIGRAARNLRPLPFDAERVAQVQEIAREEAARAGVDPNLIDVVHVPDSPHLQSWYNERGDKHRVINTAAPKNADLRTIRKNIREEIGHGWLDDDVAQGRMGELDLPLNHPLLNDLKPAYPRQAGMDGEAYRLYLINELVAKMARQDSTAWRNLVHKSWTLLRGRWGDIKYEEAAQAILHEARERAQQAASPITQEDVNMMTAAVGMPVAPVQTTPAVAAPTPAVAAPTPAVAAPAPARVAPVVAPAAPVPARPLSPVAAEMAQQFAAVTPPAPAGPAATAAEAGRTAARNKEWVPENASEKTSAQAAAAIAKANEGKGPNDVHYPLQPRPGIEPGWLDALGRPVTSLPDGRRVLANQVAAPAPAPAAPAPPLAPAPAPVPQAAAGEATATVAGTDYFRTTAGVWHYGDGTAIRRPEVIRQLNAKAKAGPIPAEIREADARAAERFEPAERYSAEPGILTDPLAERIRIAVAPTRVDTLREFARDEIAKRVRSTKMKALTQVISDVAKAYNVPIVSQMPAVGGWLITEGADKGKLSMEVPLTVDFGTSDFELVTTMAGLIGMSAPETQNSVMVWKDDLKGENTLGVVQVKSAKAGNEVAQAWMDSHNYSGFTFYPDKRIFTTVFFGDHAEAAKEFEEFVDEQRRAGRIAQGVKPDFTFGTVRFHGQSSYEADVGAARLEVRSRNPGERQGIYDVVSRSETRLQDFRQAQATAEKAKAQLAQLPVPPESTQAIIADPSRPAKFSLIRTFAKWLDARFQARYGVSMLDIGTPNALRLAASDMVHDVLSGLSEDGSGQGWYAERVRYFFREIEKVHPELKTDPNRKLVFTAILAATSQGQRPEQNLDMAEAVYYRWKQTGKMPMDFTFAKADQAVKQNLAQIQELIDTRGMAWFADFMDRTVTGGYLRSELGELPKDVMLGEEVRGSRILGPKIGAFFSNLRGLFDTITMDLWYTRSMHRYLGELTVPLTDPHAQDVIRRFRATLRKKGVRTYGLDVARAFQDDESAVEIGALLFDKWASAGYPHFRDESVERAARGVKQDVADTRSVPQNKTYRRFFEQVLREAQSQLKEMGFDLTEADLQAVLWYQEQRLFNAVGIESARPADFADAVMALRHKMEKGEGVWANKARVAARFSASPQTEGPERITNVALRFRGKYYSGDLSMTHAELHTDLAIEGIVPELDDRIVYGFTTSKGRFVGRAAAYQIAKEAKQFDVEKYAQQKTSAGEENLEALAFDATRSDIPPEDRFSMSEEPPEKYRQPLSSQQEDQVRTAWGTRLDDLMTDMPRAWREYGEQVPGSNHGLTIGTDLARDMDPEHRSGAWAAFRLSAILDPKAREFSQKLIRYVASLPGRGRDFIVLAGGMGAGKSMGEQLLRGENKIASDAVVWDNTMRDPAMALEIIRTAAANGWAVQVVYTYRPMELVLKGILPRAHKAGRNNRMDQFPANHLAAQGAFRTVAQTLKGTDVADLTVWVNDKERGKPTLGVINDVEPGGKAWHSNSEKGYEGTEEKTWREAWDKRHEKYDPDHLAGLNEELLWTYALPEWLGKQPGETYQAWRDQTRETESGSPSGRTGSGDVQSGDGRGLEQGPARYVRASQSPVEPYVKGKLARAVATLVHGNSLPKAFRDVRQWGLGMQKYMEENLRLLALDTRQALRTEFPNPKDQQKALDTLSRYWTGEAELKDLPGPALQRTAQAFRNAIDDLTTLAVGQGIVPDTQAEVWLGNRGEWLKRTYLAFDPTADWNYDALKRRVQGKDKEITRIWNNVVRFLKSQNPKLTDQELEASMRALVDRREVEGALGLGEAAMAGAGARFGVDISSLLRRKDLPVEVRDWMGQIKDPFARGLQSGKWMAQFITRNLVQRKFAALGTQLGILSEKPLGREWVELYPNRTRVVPNFEETTEEGKPTADFRVAVDRRHEPLHGYYTTPEFAAALHEFDGRMNQSVAALNGLQALGQAYLKGVGYIKMAKVGLSPFSYMLNTLGGVVMRLGAGGVNPMHFKEALGVMAQGSNPLDVKPTARQLQRRATYLLASQAGLVGQGVLFGDVRTNLQRESEPEAFKRTMLALRDVVSDSKASGAQKRLVDALTDIVGLPGEYGIRFMDDVFRVSAFLDEMALAKKAFPGQTQAQQAAWAADRASNLYQTYDRLPRLLRDLSRAGVLNTFVSFKLELFRNAFWIARYGLEGVRSSNPALRKDGALKLVSLLAMAAAPYAIAALSRALWDKDEDEVNAFQRWVTPPWDRGEELVLAGIKGKQWRYVPMGYMLPHFELTRALDAAYKAVKDPDPTDALTKSMQGVLTDYFGPGAFLGPAIEAVSNKRLGGGQITFAEGARGAVDRAKYLARAWKPNIGDPLWQAYMAATGQEGSYGRQYDWTELGLKLAGIRVRTVDVAKQLPFTMGSFNERWRNATSYEHIAARRYPHDPHRQAEATAYAERTRRQILKEYRQFRSDMISRLKIDPSDFYAAEGRARVVSDLRGSY